MSFHRWLWASALWSASGCASYTSLTAPAERSLAAARAELRQEHLRLLELEQEQAGGVRATPEARAVPPPRRIVVLVLDVEDREGLVPEADRRELSVYLGRAVVERRGYRATPRGLLAAHVRTQKAESWAPCVDDACRLELGKALAAERVLHARLLRDGGRCALGVSLYQLEREVAVWGRLEVTDCTLSALYGAAERVVAELPSGEERR
jgi:hypothetical protein